MNDERYRQLIALTKPPHNIEVYQVLMEAVQEATLHERHACARLVEDLVASTDLTETEVEAYHRYAAKILARSNF